jgi:hypothetical protein
MGAPIKLSSNGFKGHQTFGVIMHKNKPVNIIKLKIIDL